MFRTPALSPLRTLAAAALLTAGAFLSVASGAAVAQEANQPLTILSFVGLNNTVQTYDDAMQRKEKRSLDGLTVPMVVLETAREGQMLKIGENEWVRKMNTRLNHTAEVSTDTTCLVEAKRGRDKADAALVGRGLSTLCP